MKDSESRLRDFPLPETIFHSAVHGRLGAREASLARQPLNLKIEGVMRKRLKESIQEARKQEKNARGEAKGREKGMEGSQKDQRTSKSAALLIF